MLTVCLPDAKTCGIMTREFVSVGAVDDVNLGYVMRVV